LLGALVAVEVHAERPSAGGLQAGVVADIERVLEGAVMFDVRRAPPLKRGADSDCRGAAVDNQLHTIDIARVVRREKQCVAISLGLPIFTP
jgi:hypothetical protein